jgi:putative restriction endonuclease
MLEIIENYVTLFGNLRSDTVTGRWPATTLNRAPHKPLLLLAVLDLFAESRISSNLIEFTPDLGELFTLYWAKVMPPDQRGNIALPFFHLKSSGFWHLLPKPNMEPLLAASKQIKSISQLQETAFGASLDEDLYLLVQTQEVREQLRAVLIANYFDADRQAALLDQGVVNSEAFAYSNELLQQVKKVKEALLSSDKYRPVARDQGFRRAVVTAYNHSCAMCGLRVLTPDGHTATDAAHIVPWSETYDDRIVNGMALCQLCHWGFDEGMLGVSSRYLVLTSPQLEAEYNAPLHLPALQNKLLSLPTEQLYWPNTDALKTHREKTFRRR